MTEKNLNIPVIDMQNLHNLSIKENRHLEEIVGSLRQAMHESGVVYLINHGIPREIVKGAFDESKTFFELPFQTKQKWERRIDKGVKYFHGYSQPRPQGKLLNGEWVHQIRENYEIHKKRFWPTHEAPNFQVALESLEFACQSFHWKLLQLLAMTLGLEDLDYFWKASSHLNNKSLKNFSHLYTTYYPKLEPKNDDGYNSGEGEPGEGRPQVRITRCTEHIDRSILTLLFQDAIGGLEVKLPGQSEWVPVTPLENSIVVNIGELLEIWTNGFYPATVHRVVVPEIEYKMKQARQSIAYFGLPDDHFVVRPLHSGILNAVEAPSGKFEPITAYEIFEERAKKFCFK